MCLSFKEPIRDSTRTYIDHVPKRVARRGTFTYECFLAWDNIYIFNRQKCLFPPFFTGQTTNILPTMSSYLSLVSTRETTTTISLISKGMQFWGWSFTPKTKPRLQRFTRELKQLRRRPQRRLQKNKGGLMIKTTALHVHHAFKYISLTSKARLRRETS